MEKEKNNEEKIVPRLRFPEFKESWEQRKLEDVSERILRKNKDGSCNLPLTISAQYGLIDQQQFFDKQVASKDLTGYYLLHNGEFAYNKSTSNDAPWGAIKRLDAYPKGVVSTLYIAFSLKNHAVSSDFMTVLFDSDVWHREIKSIAAEGARNHGLLNISTPDFFQISLPIPSSREEQKSIGSFFKSIDATITLHQRKLDRLKVLKKALLQKMFPSEGMKVPEVRFPSFTESWEQRKLSEITTKITDGSHSSPSAVDEGYYMPSVVNMTIDGFDFTNCKKIAKDDFEYLIKNGCKPEIGDVLIAKDGSVLKHVFSVKEERNIVILSSIAIVRPSENIEPDYLVQVFKRPDFVSKVLAENITGTGVPRIILKNFKNLMIPVPAKKEQIEIAGLLSEVDQTLALHQRRLDHYKLLKKGLLQQMFPTDRKEG